ncbi:hypothetical protein BpHYR1_024129 [Brachionus plicatilis]|uniref:Uncharacterized protein n=1 Tax=Brachionus plicatilis TaxID=10195 RepID=A0A3M7TAK5_BRAPC|nr:hypothetical protein BpHYR1_024129 [Brachionus plicatilis]
MVGMNHSILLFSKLADLHTSGERIKRRYIEYPTLMFVPPTKTGNLPARDSLSDIEIINSISNAENKDDSDSEVEDITKPKKSDFSSRQISY